MSKIDASIVAFGLSKIDASIDAFGLSKIDASIDAFWFCRFDENPLVVAINCFELLVAFSKSIKVYRLMGNKWVISIKCKKGGKKNKNQFT